MKEIQRQNKRNFKAVMLIEIMLIIVFILVVSLGFISPNNNSFDGKKNFHSYSTNDTGIRQNGFKIGVWQYFIDSLNVLYRQYYHYSPKLDSTILETEEYIRDTSVLVRIDYSKYGLNWQHIKARDISLLNKVKPFYNTHLGFDLYVSNCTGCHEYPTAKNHFMYNALKKLKEENIESAFFKDGKTSETTGTNIHGKLEQLDTLEIGAIERYIESSCTVYSNKQY